MTLQKAKRILLTHGLSIESHTDNTIIIKNVGYVVNLETGKNEWFDEILRFEDNGSILCVEHNNMYYTTIYDYLGY